MAISKKVSDVKLQFRFENGTNSYGQTKYKTVSLSNIKLNASDEQLFDAGTAYAGLTAQVLGGLSRVDVSDLVSTD